MALLGNLTGSSQFFNPLAFYNGVAKQSLRFDDGSSAYLTRTPSSAGNRKTWTWSGWVKRGNIGGTHIVFSAVNPTFDGITFEQDKLRLTLASGGTAEIETSVVFRDTSAWYHIVAVVDTTNGTSTDRLRIYINGERITSFGSASYPSQNYDGFINQTIEHNIAKRVGSSFFFDGYMSEVNFVDGTALDPTSFGEFKNGVWIAKRYTGSYGTNGFRLQFNQTGVGTASTSTIGADTSGNTHHFTSSGIVASDCAMPDSPENNFCTLNGVAKSTGLTLSQGNLQTNNSGDFALGTIGVNSGKWYYENYINSTNGGFAGVYESDSGVYSTTIDDGGNNPDGYGYYSNGQKVRNGSYVNYGSAFTTAGDIIGVALDMDNGAIYFSKNGTWQNSATTSEISAGTTTNSAYTGLSGNMVARVGHYNNNNPTIVNFGQDDTFAGAISSAGNTDGNGKGVFKYAPPSGFLALCTSNLPELTIGPNSVTQADDHFNTVTYTGNGGTLAVDGFGHQPDLLWIKSRNITGNHRWTDSSRGVTNNIISNANDAEKGSSDAEDIDSFDTDGFTVTQASYDDFNDGSDTYVAWSWKANGGTTSSNSDGSITSTVQANTTAGFSIVTYTGTGSGATIGHGLGAVPQMFIVKNRDSAEEWLVYHHKNTSAPETDALQLSLNSATVDSAGAWNDTAPTSSVFSVGSGNASNKSGDAMIAYCFAEIEGYSKIGKYNPNNSTDNAFVYTGFKPAMVILKGAELNNQEWGILDNKRPGYNSVYFLQPQSDSVETTGNIVDFLSNGFKIRETGGVGYSTSNYIYIAFAEAPFKYANAG